MRDSHESITGNGTVTGVVAQPPSSSAARSTARLVLGFIREQTLPDLLEQMTVRRFNLGLLEELSTAFVNGISSIRHALEKQTETEASSEVRSA